MARLPTAGRRLPARFELGRVSANTKLVSGGAASTVTVRRLRVRGGNFKFRALRLDSGNYSWPSQAVTRKTRILDVNYNASNNELARRHPPAPRATSEPAGAETLSRSARLVGGTDASPVPSGAHADAGEGRCRANRRHAVPPGANLFFTHRPACLLRGSAPWLLFITPHA